MRAQTVLGIASRVGVSTSQEVAAVSITQVQPLSVDVEHVTLQAIECLRSWPLSSGFFWVREPVVKKWCGAYANCGARTASLIFRIASEGSKKKLGWTAIL